MKNMARIPDCRLNIMRYHYYRNSELCVDLGNQLVKLRRYNVVSLAGVTGQVISLFTIHSLEFFELFAIIMMIGLGLIFSTTNTLAMNEGRNKAGEASAILGVSGYIVGATVSPLVGMGNILHSTAIAFAILAALTAVTAYLSSRISPDLQD